MIQMANLYMILHLHSYYIILIKYFSAIPFYYGQLIQYLKSWNNNILIKPIVLYLTNKNIRVKYPQIKTEHNQTQI